MKTYAVRLPDEPVVSNDPEVQEALERMCIETMATYRLVSTCWVMLRDARAVRRLCEFRDIGISERQIVRVVKTVVKHAGALGVSPVGVLESVWDAVGGLTLRLWQALERRMLALTSEPEVEDG